MEANPPGEKYLVFILRTLEIFHGRFQRQGKLALTGEYRARFNSIVLETYLKLAQEQRGKENGS